MTNHNEYVYIRKLIKEHIFLLLNLFNEKHFNLFVNFKFFIFPISIKFKTVHFNVLKDGKKKRENLRDLGRKIPKSTWKLLMSMEII